MDITTIEKYKYNGKEYGKLKEIQTEIENSIGSIIDYSDVTLTPKQKLKVFAAIIKHRKELVKLLTVNYIDERESSLRPDTVNILDMKL